MEKEGMAGQGRDKEPLYQIRLSVRGLVEFVMNSGDIDNRRTAGARKDAMLEGGRLHRKIQKKMGSHYRAEVTINHVVKREGMKILIEGRADGVIEEPKDVVIDEIKCMYGDISRLEEPIAVHLAQAMCYGYFWCLSYGLSHIILQVTYCQIKTEEIRRFRQKKTAKELEVWFKGLIGEYMKWANYQRQHDEKRQQSLKQLVFPFPYRKGQRELAVSVYRAIARGRNLYIQAPTGIGKTISVLFPALKAMGEGHGDKLFYLTAKTVTRRAAEEALDILREKGLHFTSVFITAKEKICFLEKMECNPEACPYAKGHFDRVNDAVYGMISQESAITRERIMEYAKRYQVCPFEFCLDISNWVDGIICDYNYVFDPDVRLKRYFAEGQKGEYLFLVDEAHNLVDRARAMYSAFLVKEEVVSAKRLVKKVAGTRFDKLVRLLEGCNKSMLELKRACETFQIVEDVNLLALQVMGVFEELELFLEEMPEFEDRDLLLDFYFQIRDFLYVFERLDKGYEIYSRMMPDGSFMVRLFCIDPSGPLRACMDQGISTILFSATLLPVTYYKELLSGEPKGYAIYADSPFRREKRLLLVSEDVSGRYTRRNQKEYEKVAAYIREIVKGRQGNYMVFCPSYQYLGEVEKILREKEELRDFRLLIQESRMDERQREAFLAEFFTGGISLVALCVLGGIFGEGIDLKEESLIGVVIIGSGLPMVGPEQDILKGYFERHGKPGFSYAYQYPGLNKVMQAAGRVIRTMEDEGVIVLLEERFLQPDYQALFPREWSDYQRTSLCRVGTQVADFWAGRAGV